MPRTITALFDARADAQAAAASLQRLGAGQVRLHPETPLAEPASPSQDLFGELIDLFVPPHHREAYDAGLRRGATALSAEIADDQAAQAMQVFEENGAIQLQAEPEADGAMRMRDIIL